MSHDLETDEMTTGTASYPVIEEPVSRTGRTLTVIGFVCAVLALMVLPVLFGAAAVAFGAVGWWSGDRWGKWAVLAGVVCAVAGVAASHVAVNNSRTGY